MNAKTFTDKLVEKVVLLQPQGYGSQWTRGMYPVLYEIGFEGGLYVNCHPFDYKGNLVGHSEILYIDFMYFPNKFDSNGYIYHQPAVVIEHENNWDFPSKRADFWKLCLFASPLRVFIGYCKNEEVARAQGLQLAKLYSDHDMKQIAGGETLILISTDEAAGKTWLAWLLKGDSQDWREGKIEQGVAAEWS